jgi:hypothetical protein
MAIERVESGRPPLLWSDIQQAFDVINQNFTELNARTDDGSTLGLGFDALFTDVSPAITGQFNLGQDNKTWKSLYLSEIINIAGNDNNGLWIGSGHISGVDGKINLPTGSTIDQELIINPDNTFFKTFSVSGEDDVSAVTFADIIEFSGSGISITTDAANKTINFSNDGVISLTGTAGQIGVDTSTGNVTLTNLGVLSVDNNTYAPSNPVASPTLSFTNRGPGAGIVVSESTGNVTITNTGVLGIVNGSTESLIITTEPTTGIVTISNIAPNISQQTFNNVVKFGQAVSIIATSPADTLNLDEGYGINLNFDTLLKKITVELDQRIDIIGSVFADNSTLLVDGISGTVPGTLTGSWISPGNSFTIIGEGLSVSSQNTALTISNDGISYANNLNNENTAISISNGNVSLSMSGNITVSAQGSVTISSGPVSAAVDGAITIANNGNVSWAVNGDFVVAANNININSGGISANTFTGDLTGSVFGADSAMLINSLDSKVVGPVDTTTVTTERLIEKTNEISGATGIVEHNCTNAQIFIHTDIVGNFNVDLTNFELNVGESTTVTTVLVQGATGYTVNGFRLNGDVISLRWVGAAQPAGTVNRRDIIKFDILRRTEGYTVYGELKSFG